MSQHARSPQELLTLMLLHLELPLSLHTEGVHGPLAQRSLLPDIAPAELSPTSSFQETHTESSFLVLLYHLTVFGARGSFQVFYLCKRVGVGALRLSELGLSVFTKCE